MRAFRDCESGGGRAGGISIAADRRTAALLLRGDFRKKFEELVAAKLRLLTPRSQRRFRMPMPEPRHNAIFALACGRPRHRWSGIPAISSPSLPVFCNRNHDRSNAYFLWYTRRRRFVGPGHCMPRGFLHRILRDDDGSIYFAFLNLRRAIGFPRSS
jgi:hypothetical protein